MAEEWSQITYLYNLSSILKGRFFFFFFTIGAHEEDRKVRATDKNPLSASVPLKQAAVLHLRKWQTADLQLRIKPRPFPTLSAVSFPQTALMCLILAELPVSTHWQLSIHSPSSSNSKKHWNKRAFCVWLPQTKHANKRAWLQCVLFAAALFAESRQFRIPPHCINRRIVWACWWRRLKFECTSAAALWLIVLGDGQTGRTGQKRPADISLATRRDLSAQSPGLKSCAPRGQIRWQIGVFMEDVGSRQWWYTPFCFLV